VDYKRFIYVEVGWPGSVGDGRVWRNSVLRTRYKEWLSQFATAPLQTGDVISEDIPAFILADSAYPNTKHMVTTFKTAECADPVIWALNQKLGGARYHIEKAFGIMKARFQIFQRPIECVEDIRFAIILTASIFVLHNFLIDIEDETREDDLSVNGNEDEDDLESDHWQNSNEDENDEDAEVEDNLSTRQALIRHMRYLLEEE
jgi:DDE superfamily endonuclease